MKQTFYDIIGCEYVNRGNGKLCYIEDVLCDYATGQYNVHYRTYDNIDGLLKTPYRYFKSSWRKNGWHVPVAGKLYVSNTHGKSEIVCVEGISNPYGYAETEKEKYYVVYTILNTGRSMRYDLPVFNRLYKLLDEQD